MQLNLSILMVLVLVLVLALVPSVLMASELERQASGEQPAAAEEEDRSPRVPTFPLQGDLAGELQVFTTAYEDTFAAIGNDLALGYLELVRSEEHTSELQSR